MDTADSIRAALADPGQLESLYQAARRRGQTGEFAAMLEACYEQAPDNPLYAAWHYRLQAEAAPRMVAARWRVAVPLALLSSLVFAALTDESLSLPEYIPLVMFLWAPLAGAAIIAFLALAGRSSWRRPVLAVVGLAAATVYALLWARLPLLRDYRTLMLLHLPLAAWIAVVLALLGTRPGREPLFAVLAKSVEVLITGGVFAIVTMIFVAIAGGMLSQLGVWIRPEIGTRLVGAALGALPVLAVATVYDPEREPLDQTFEQGAGHLLITITRLLLVPASAVLVVVLGLIPFSFMRPFADRGLLIAYNVMLFAVMALVLGAAPVRGEGFAPRYRRALRAGIVAVAGLAVLVSLYALSATVYRTVLGGLTPNRMTVIGWNAVNIAILGALVATQLRSPEERWLYALHGAYARGAAAYVVWGVFLIVATPLIFR